MSSYTAGTSFKRASDTEGDWYVVDATDVVLGRLAAEVAKRLRGKHKPAYTPHNTSCSDKIIIVNAEKVKLTGSNKANDMVFYWHTGYPGGLKERKAKDILSGKRPTRLLAKAIERMMPKESPLARTQLKGLYLYTGSEHPHAAQNPKDLDIGAKNPKNRR